MTDTENAIVVFTARSPSRVVRERGSQAWVLNPARAKQCKWLVCTQNRHNPDHEFSDATEDHSAAFLIGKVSAVRPAEDGSEDRWIVEISEYAFIDKADVWKGWRNPVRYTSLAEVGIDVDGLEFQAIERAAPVGAQVPARSEDWPPATLTIPDAKKALAATFGVKPEAVEITIRG